MSVSGFADEGWHLPEGPPLPKRATTVPQWACTRDEFVAAASRVWRIAEPGWAEDLADAIGEHLPSLPSLTAVSDHKCSGDTRRPFDYTGPGPCPRCHKPYRRICLEADLAAVLAELSKEPWPARPDPLDDAGLLSALGDVVFQYPPAAAVDGQGAANGTAPVSVDPDTLSVAEDGSQRDAGSAL